MKKIRSLLLLLISLTAAGGLYGESQKILVLNSYHQGFHWTDRIMEGILSELEERDDVELQIIYMDTKRISDTAYLEILNEEYTYKYREVNFSVILSTDDHALDFLLQYGDTLFPGVPVIFCGINAFQPERIAGHDNFTGVSEAYDVKDLLDLTTRLHRERTNITVILDSTLSSEQFLRLMTQEEMNRIGHLKINYLNGLSQKELIKELNLLNEDDLIFWGLHLRGGPGEFYTVKQSLELVKSVTDVPIYSLWDVVGFGVVGGKVARPQEQGKIAAAMTLAVLDGTPINEFRVVPGSLVYLFDYRELKTQGIKISDLPRDSIIINKPFALFRENKKIFMIILILFIFLLVVISILIWDISRRKKAEAQLILNREQLLHSRKMDALGQLAGGVAHDFNNILTGIMGATDMITPDQDPVEQKTYLDMIISSSQQAADLTAQLLAFGRKGKKHYEELDMHCIIEDTIFILKQTLKKKYVLESHLRAEKSIIEGNKSALQNIIMNLCINASQSMAKGGTITLGTAERKLGRDFCHNSPFKIEPGHYFEVSIRDRGEGIPEDILERIFEPFFTTKGQGSGLGLATVYKTVQDHKGAIRVMSEMGKGTEFLLYFSLV